MSAHHYRVPYPARGSVLGESEAAALTEVLGSGRSLSAGRYREEFERRFSELVGTRHAISVTSGTVALALATGLLDLGPGDEVIATPQTYKATVQPLLSLPVTVRFCDVDEHTLNADPASIEALVTPRTRALFLVHYGGLPADMDEIMRIARAHDILVVEDCAHALGAGLGPRRPGALADIGCFSFHSSKNITTLGEGGMVTVADDVWRERLDRIRSNDSDAVFVHAPTRLGELEAAPAWMVHAGNAYTHDCVDLRHPGTNATLSEPCAAVGIAQLDRLDEMVARRRQIAGRITDVVRRSPVTRCVREPPDTVNAHHLYTFFVDPPAGADRDRIVERLARDGVQVQLRYFPLHLTPEWRARGHRPGECPVAERMWFREQVNLPCQPTLTEPEIAHMLDALARVLPAADGDTPAAAVARPTEDAP